MARPESTAVGGYYATPQHLVPRIAALLSAPTTGVVSVTDPCAGDGDAVLGLIDALFGASDQSDVNVHLFTAEMEETRAKALAARRGRDLAWGCCHFVHGDAFRVIWSTSGESSGVSFAFINPPYDTDPDHGRLEERFLARFASAIREGGVLVFLVPFYALAASARTLATHFRDLHCYQFPGADFDLFKQVVLVGTKRAPLLAPDRRVVAKVEAWSASAARMPELPEPYEVKIPAARIPASSPYSSPGIGTWALAPLDVSGLLTKFVPWHMSDRGGRLQPVAGVVPELPAAELLTRRYPVAMPPKPAHIAAGIAAGVFNGARVEPDDPSSGLPPLLVKGVFDKEFVVVDEKKNKDGDKTGEIQVQQPRLVVTVLDLEARRYHTLASSSEITGARDVASMTTADLLAAYGRALTRVMLEQCPVLHDPGRDDHLLPLPELPRQLYTAQAHAVMAAVKLLGGVAAPWRARRGKSCFILGEIGSGKTSVALATAVTIGARRVLVLCPPHLLDSWRDQVAAVVPWARVVVLREPADVDELAAADDPGMVIAILSRETAKLGHAWAGVGAVCPGCGAATPDDDLARKRARCAATRRVPTSISSRLAVELATALMQAAPADETVALLLSGRNAQRMLARYTIAKAEGHLDDAWVRVVTSGRVQQLVRRLGSRIARMRKREQIERAGQALLCLHAAVADPVLAWDVGVDLEAAARADTDPYGHGHALRSVARRLMMLVPKGRPLGDNPEWIEWQRQHRTLHAGDAVSWDYHGVSLEDGELHWMDHPLGAVDHAIAALEKLAEIGSWRIEHCGEFLFQAVPEPRRYPLATYLARRHPKLIDLLVLDEGHEYAGDGSAQGFAAHRLVELGVPTLLMTGSVMGGYAESLFANQWALDADFRGEFSRGARHDFVRRYGYLKQLVEMRDKDGKAVAWGAVTDRCERSVRTIGQAPGVLPLFVLRHLLRRAVTLHKSDLALDLPPCREIADTVEPTPDLKERFERLQKALVAQIKADRFSPLAGKLWGQMAELPSYLDRATADTGNVDGGAYEIAYPEGVDAGIVAREEPLPASTVLPKERWMLDAITRELGEGRRVLVFAWHQAVLPRLARLISRHLGDPCPILEAGKVSAAKRQAWIDREVIGKDRRVLVVNPVAVQTGLNNLVWFSTEIWMQNPGCNAIVYRQATGRVDRIGQKQETRIYFPVYSDTAQAALHKLLLHKVGVSQSTDGLDAESALAAAGVGSSGFDGFAVGRMLYEVLVGDRRIPALVATPRTVPRPAAPVLVADRPQLVKPATTRDGQQLGLFGGAA